MLNSHSWILAEFSIFLPPSTTVRLGEVPFQKGCSQVFQRLPETCWKSQQESPFLFWVHMQFLYFRAFFSWEGKSWLSTPQDPVRPAWWHMACRRTHRDSLRIDLKICQCIVHLDLMVNYKRTQHHQMTNLPSNLPYNWLRPFWFVWNHLMVKNHTNHQMCFCITHRRSAPNHSPIMSRLLVTPPALVPKPTGYDWLELCIVLPCLETNVFLRQLLC